MIFWLLVVGVLCLALGFVLGATFRQYKRPKTINVTAIHNETSRFDRAVDWVMRDEFFTTSGAHHAWRK